MSTQSAPGGLRPGSALRVVTYPVLGALGVPVAVAGSLVQGGWFPGGLMLALAGSAGLFHGGGLLTRSRIGAALPAFVWFLTVMYLSMVRPEGDFLFTAGLSPYIYLLGGMAIGAVCATLPRRTPPGAPGARLGR